MNQARKKKHSLIAGLAALALLSTGHSFAENKSEAELVIFDHNGRGDRMEIGRPLVETSDGKWKAGFRYKLRFAHASDSDSVKVSLYLGKKKVDSTTKCEINDYKEHRGLENHVLEIFCDPDRFDKAHAKTGKVHFQIEYTSTQKKKSYRVDTPAFPITKRKLSRGGKTKDFYFYPDLSAYVGPVLVVQDNVISRRAAMAGDRSVLISTVTQLPKDDIDNVELLCSRGGKSARYSASVYGHMPYDERDIPFLIVSAQLDRDDAKSFLDGEGTWSCRFVAGKTKLRSFELTVKDKSVVGNNACQKESTYRDAHIDYRLDWRDHLKRRKAKSPLRQPRPKYLLATLKGKQGEKFRAEAYSVEKKASKSCKGVLTR